MSIAVLGQNALLRAGLVSLLTTLGFDQVAEAATLEELRQLRNLENLEILLVHLSDGTEDLFRSIQEIRMELAGTKIVILSTKLDLKVMSNCFSAGASGFLLENLSRDALQQSLTLVRTGEKIFPSELAPFIAEFAASEKGEEKLVELETFDLSQREIQILRLLASGYSNKRIAARLDITESTVKVHLKHILRKIRVSNRTQAALWAVRRGIVLSPPDDLGNSDRQGEVSEASPPDVAVPETPDPLKC